jgi:RNA polymerase sigma factor (sigma-70 family)
MRLAVRWPRVDSPDAYVYETLSHLAIDHHRLSSTRHEYVAGDLTQFDALAAPDGPESAEIREDLMSALRALPPAQRATVALRYLCDQDERETARLLGCSVGAVKSQTSRGLVRLRELVSRTSRGSASEPCPTDTSTARRGS